MTVNVLARCFVCLAEMELPVEVLVERIEDARRVADETEKTTLVFECQPCINREMN